MINFRIIPPSAALAQHVQSYWVMEAPAGKGRHIILPDGFIELVFQFKGGFRTVGNGSPHPVGLLVGQMRRRFEVEPSGPVGLFGVRLRPGRANVFFRAPQSEFTDKIVSLEDIWGRAGQELRERMLEARDDRDRVGLVEQSLMAHMREPESCPAVNTALYLVLASAGTTRLSHLAFETGANARQLERGFRDRVGISPKMLSRVIRFQRLLRTIREGSVSWARLAVEGGYYDQAHLIREFRQFTGRTPGDYIKHAIDVGRAFTGGPGVRFVGFLQDFSGLTDYAGFTTFRRLIWLDEACGLPLASLAARTAGDKRLGLV